MNIILVKNQSENVWPPAPPITESSHPTGLSWKENLDISECELFYAGIFKNQDVSRDYII